MSMFPWSSEFVWDAGHVVFFGALYGVLAVIAASLLVATRRALRLVSGGRGAAVAWHAEFCELPASARACRHQLTGEAPGRVCDNAFDCGSCREHPKLLALRAQPEDAAGTLDTPDPRHRLYHRGHTWARPEKNGTVTVGLDGMARRLLGPTSRVSLPACGSRLEANGELARASVRGAVVRLLSPVAGTVSEVRGEGIHFKLRVQPEPVLDLRHLLSGPEAKVWSLRELERVERALGPVGGYPALADGGELIKDLGEVLPRDRYDALLGETFLEA